ncbi:hypothetical protein B0A48_09426 [Cryoendolithus antarcticus]|uniref:Uncharacterized protein n=1 Tax=Cryoendolithus antarcticus TaxID=1507870 RepID=A0A1V8SZK1_9PEZI|nr:hypothetical protein B0A48_09426 [Cryoendolithus antarcticus]
MPAQGKIDWDSIDAWKRLIAAIHASGIKLDLRQIATLFGTTYDTLENRLRTIKKDAAVLKDDVTSGKRGEVTPARGTPKKTPAKKTGLGLDGVTNGRVTKTPTKSASKKGNGIKAEALANVDFFADQPANGFDGRFEMHGMEENGMGLENSKPNTPKMSVWNAERDQHLLVLLIDQLNLGGCDEIAKAWKTKYAGIDSYVPTARAISEHVKSLKKTAGGSSTGSAATPKKTASTPAKVTPKRPTQAKTPTSSAKRSRAQAMSEEDEEPMSDDSEPDHKTLKKIKPEPRKNPSRRSKSASAGVSYQQSESEADTEVEVEKAEGVASMDGATDARETSNKFRPPTDLAKGTIAPQGKAAGPAGAKAASFDGAADDSDVSSFSADFGA